MNNSKEKTKCWTIILKQIIKLASDIPWYAKKNENEKKSNWSENETKMRTSQMISSQNLKMVISTGIFSEIDLEAQNNEFKLVFF